MKYETPYIMIKLHKREDVITLSNVEVENPDDSIDFGDLN